MSGGEAEQQRPTVTIDEHLIEQGAEALRPLTTDIRPVRRALATTVLAAVLPEHRAQVIRECAEAVRRNAERSGDSAELLDRMAEATVRGS